MESSSREDHNLPRVSDLLATKPFERFREFNLGNAQELPRAWFERKLQEGKPFIIRGLKNPPRWDEKLLSTETLADLSAKEVDVHHCIRDRTSTIPLRDLIRRHGSQWDKPLYARDISCPREWRNAIESIVSPPLWHLGPTDLARHLPKLAQSEVVMAHVGMKGSFTGFHWADSGCASLNLLTESEGPGPGSIWFGIDNQSSAKYDEFLRSIRIPPHSNWKMISPESLRLADFPVYVVEQYPGDLVVFPSGAPHQVVNLGKLVTTVAWNIYHSSSVCIFNDYLEPEYNQICRDDIGRVPMIPSHTLQRACDRSFDLENEFNRRDVELMLEIFAKLFFDERLPSSVMVETESSSDIFTCSFCESVIWNRYVHCAKCPDFDLCFRCFIAGRSCKFHYAEYSFKQLTPVKTHEDLITAIEAKLGRRTRTEKPRVSLGELAAKSAQDRRKSELTAKGCHTCRYKHQIGETLQCTKCAKFYCLRNFAYQPKGKFQTRLAKIPPDLKRGFIDVTNPLGPGPRRPRRESDEPPAQARKRPRLEERILGEAAREPANPIQPTPRTQNLRTGGTRRYWLSGSGGNGLDSQTPSIKSGTDTDDDELSDDTDWNRSQEIIKVEPSSPARPSSQPETAHQLEPDDASHARSPPARRSDFPTQAMPQPVHVGDSRHVSASTSVPTGLPDTVARDSRNRSLSNNRPNPPNTQVNSQQPSARTEENPRTSTIPAQHLSNPAPARETASQDSLSVNGPVPSNTQASALQSTTSATHPRGIPPSPSRSSSTNGNSIASRTEKLQMLQRCADLVLAQDRAEPLYEKMCTEIAKIEAAIAEDQAKAQTLLPGLEQDFPDMAAEFRELFQC